MAVRVVDLEEEQPIENISYFHDYASMIASQLEGTHCFCIFLAAGSWFPRVLGGCLCPPAFVASQGTDGDTLVDALQRCQQSGCLSLSCMDYILASVEYEDFIGLVLDFQSASQWQDERGEADDDKAAV